ncbi:hypothetical protein GCM10025778_33100 [Paeniglutamicibacter antarcticus]|uniref:Uncharacterized protein n=2 Tax=Paeniglutamicibacter antarcticus TaxID=494023 RepID=A0ABP9TPZ9_9MICC
MRPFGVDVVRMKKSLITKNGVTMKKIFGSALAAMLFAGAVFVGSAVEAPQGNVDAASHSFSISKAASNNWPF